MAVVRRKCFISYHHADQEAVDQFVKDFDHEHDTFIARGLGAEMPGDVIQSTNSDYIMRRIREKFLGGSTVTIVLMGRCTWARRYVDWELQSSLRHGGNTTPNGLLGIKLPSFGGFPPRFDNNLSSDWPAVDC
ncbi:TIR domain-containing protein [Roseobacter sp. MH60115]|uniref:TIR domain-containing protein n=1 Tax=Roseobacter sp. MH60115 TaxID=2785324 RepID=UPI001E6108A4|nr:TIR domain-containing protein [Roseobacter sp. MH60115]